MWQPDLNTDRLQWTNGHFYETRKRYFYEERVGHFYKMDGRRNYSGGMKGVYNVRTDSLQRDGWADLQHDKRTSSQNKAGAENLK